jgi:aryl-alcohol dehydrogenase-like predicted oxidoreductase
MTFGEQVGEADSHAILDRSLERGVNFIDTAEMYAVPARAPTFGATETIIGNWFAKHPGARQKLVLATKVAGPSRGMPWIREGKGMTAADIVASCEGSLRRLQTDVIDLYQIHWPERHVPAFGTKYYDPAKENAQTPIHEQLQALAGLVQAGKVRHVGLSNETPYGVHEFVRLAEQHGLPRVARCRTLLPDQPQLRQRAGRDLPPSERVAAGVFAAGLWPVDGQVRRQRHRRARCAPRRSHCQL